MKQQDDDEGRREMAHTLLMIMMGVIPFEQIQEELRTGGLYMRRITLPSGAERFIVFRRCNGQVWDSFTFHGEESLDYIDERHAAA